MQISEFWLWLEVAQAGSIINGALMSSYRGVPKDDREKSSTLHKSPIHQKSFPTVHKKKKIWRKTEKSNKISFLILIISILFLPLSIYPDFILGNIGPSRWYRGEGWATKARGSSSRSSHNNTSCQEKNVQRIYLADPA